MPPPALIPRVKQLGMPAVAMTDHGNMFGAVEFYKKAVAESKWAKSTTYNNKPAGHIALQDHGDEVWYRDVKVRDLSAK